LQSQYALIKWTDVTSQPGENLLPDPNQYNIQVVAEDTVLDAIDADPDFPIVPGTRQPVDPGVQLLGSGDIPTQQEFDEWRVELSNVISPITQTPVWTTAEIIEAVGTTPDGRTWEQINTEYNTWLAERPQGAANYAIEPEQVGGDVGYVKDIVGVLEPDTYFAVSIGSLLTNPAVGGILAFELNSALSQEDNVRYVRIVSADVTLLVEDALFSDNKFVWFGTGYNFTPGVPVVVQIGKN
jgi:hypothetical protein